MSWTDEQVLLVWQLTRRLAFEAGYEAGRRDEQQLIDAAGLEDRDRWASQPLDPRTPEQRHEDRVTARRAVYDQCYERRQRQIKESSGG